MLHDLEAEVFGLGPLEPLMHDPTISDILVNDAHEVYVERRGRLELTEIVFADDAHLMRIIQRVVARVGRRIDEVSPMVDARLPDGSRVNAIVPPLALDGPKLSIRRFGAEHSEARRPAGQRLAARPRWCSSCCGAVQARISFLISGGTGAGKTTLLNALSAFIPHDERLITIEDSAELMLQQPPRRPPGNAADATAKGRARSRSATWCATVLRMRPDRILVGEVRGAERSTCSRR